jgi:tetratricopeptide (TPR) repeat protein
MNPSDIRLDALGFPIPRTFDDLQTLSTPSGTPPRKPSRGTRTVRVALVALAVGAAIMAVLRAELGEPAGKAIAQWLASHGARKYDADDLDGAARDLDRALAWSDKSPVIFELRGQVRLEKGDLLGSLADFNKTIDLAPHSTEPYVARAMVLQRLERHEDAIRDLSQAIRLHRNSDVPLLRYAPYTRSELLNSRAYTRAIAGLELDAALADIDRAITMEGENAHYLDTRGYIYFLLEDYHRANEDLEKALKIAEDNEPLPGLIIAGDTPRQRRLARVKRQYDQALAVIHHHSGQIYEKLGDVAKAEAHLRQGDRLGYNPAAGVY